MDRRTFLTAGLASTIPSIPDPWQRDEFEEIPLVFATDLVSALPERLNQVIRAVNELRRKRR